MKQLLLIALLLTIFAKLILPSQYYTGDMVIHIPFILKYSNPTLYQDDYLLTNTNPQNVTMYYPVLAHLLQITKLSLLHLLNAIHTITLFFFFLALLIITSGFQKPFAGLLLSLFLLLRIPIGGAAIQTIETEPLPRAIALIFTLWCVIFLQRKKYLLSGLIFLLIIIIHPLSVLFFSCILITWYLFQKQKHFNWIWAALIIFSISVLLSFLPTATPDWLSIIKLRNPYAFITQWQSTSFLILFISLLPGIWYSFIYKNSNHQLASLFKVVLIISLIISLFQIIFTSVHPLSLIINLQLGRIWWYPVTVSLTVFATVFNRHKKLTTALVLSLLIAVVIERNILTQQNTNDHWLTALNWIRTNIPQNCSFLVPFMSQGFRVESMHPSTGEYKDGALSFYSLNFAEEWKKRLDALKDWQKNPDQELVELQKNYGFHYAIEETTHGQRQFPIVYENQDFRSYSVTACK